MDSMPIHQGRELPRLSFRQIDLPEVAEWEVNGEYFLVVKVEMTGKNNKSYLESHQDMKKLEGEFKVKSVMALKDKPVDRKSLEKKEFEKAIARVKSGEYA